MSLSSLLASSAVECPLNGTCKMFRVDPKETGSRTGYFSVPVRTIWVGRPVYSFDYVFLVAL